MAKQDDYVRYTIRIPPDIHRQLQLKAGEKSLNAEIIQRLEASLNNQYTSFEDMAELFAAKVADKLKGQ